MIFTNSIKAPKIVVLVSGFSYPSRDGMHIQFTKTLQSILDIKTEFGATVDLYLVTKKQSALNLDALCAAFKGIDHVKAIQVRLPYACLMVLSYILPSIILNLLFKQSRKCDLLFIEGIPLAPLSRYFCASRILISALDAWSLRQRRFARKSKGVRKWMLKLYSLFSLYIERKIYQQADALHVVSGVDASYYKKVLKRSNVLTIPVAVISEAIPCENNMSLLNEGRTVLFWGDIGYAYIKEGLVWFLKEIWPNIRHSYDGMKLVILGRREPDRALKELAGNNTDFLVWCENLNALLTQTNLIVLPDISGTGLKNRTIQALYSGRPVVGSLYAFSGIPIKNGVNGLVPRTQSEWIDMIFKLLNDDRTASDIGESGRLFVTTFFSQKAVSNSWKKLLKHMLLSKGPISEIAKIS
jgi:glycosyltransferase involved in cell wall biosynthesis